MSKSNRKGPTESATLYPVGTKRKGNDGRMWIIKKTSSGVQRWVPLPEKSLIKIKKGDIESFDIRIIPRLNQGKIRKIGYLHITSNKIGIGELLFNDYPTKPGRHNIYYYYGSLIAIHEDEDPTKQIFKFTKRSANSDIGMFAFIDSKRVRPYIVKSKIKAYGDYFPNFPTSILKKEYDYIYESDLEINKDRTVDSKKPIAIFAENQFGDGSFSIYKGTNAYWIMSNNTYEMLLEFADPSLLMDEWKPVQRQRKMAKKHSGRKK